MREREQVPQDFPQDCQELLQTIKSILGTHLGLVKKGLVSTEAEQLLIASYQMEKGEKISRLNFYTQTKKKISPQVVKRSLQFAQLRAQGKLLQHITGFQTFLGHDYEVGPEVLIPRPETEVLLETALKVFEEQGRVPTLGLEIGLGSGILSIELLARYSRLKMVATELQFEARALAQRNALRILGEDAQGSLRLEILAANQSLEVWEPFERHQSLPRADFLISNPPYLGSLAEVDEEVWHQEPWEALFAPPEDILFFYRQVVSRASEFIQPGGMILMEVPHERADEIKSLFLGLKAHIEVVKDLNQRDRVLVVRA